MSFKATLVAALPEARRIYNFLDRDWAEEGVVVALDERPDGLWSVEAYFETGDPQAIRTALCDRLGADAFGALTDVTELPPENWVALGLQSLAPVMAGRFAIHGRHDRDRLPAGRTSIEIEAGQAFGSGHHGTTAGCIEVLDRLLRGRRYDNALDLGCGSGVLAIALAKLLHRPVLATDIDPIAVRVAAENAQLNHVGPWLRCVVANGLAHQDIRARSPFDLIVANILAEPLMRLAPEVSAALAAGGDLVLSGLLVRQRERVVGAYGRQGLQLQSARRFGDWSVLHLRRPGMRR